jgi:hypothetical protein
MRVLLRMRIPTLSKRPIFRRARPLPKSTAKNIIGDLLYFPARVFDSIKVLSGRIKLLVIDSPHYGEDPAKLIKSREQ